MSIQLRTGPWRLTDLADVPKNGLNVFSCFSCGGGSTMGYKLAGYTVLGCVEIDPEMLKIYRANHNPKYPFLMGVQDFKKLPNDQLPKELFELDILDGSPPCSSFSMAGAREKKWGKASKFREGQAVQNLDDLFFDYIDVVEKLKPKVVVAENVKGLVAGNARGYVKQIFARFRSAGYEPQLFLLNAAAMGVPQRRERTVFVARRADFGFPKLDLNFSEDLVSVEKAFSGIPKAQVFKKPSAMLIDLWSKTKPGHSFKEAHPRGSWFNWHRLHQKEAAPTLIGSGTLTHPTEARKLTDLEACRIQSFPDDYNFGGSDGLYICGMSVPPFMMQRIAHQIQVQWLSRL